MPGSRQLAGKAAARAEETASDQDRSEEQGAKEQPKQAAKEREVPQPWVVATKGRPDCQRNDEDDEADKADQQVDAQNPMHFKECRRIDRGEPRSAGPVFRNDP